MLGQFPASHLDVVLHQPAAPVTHDVWSNSLFLAAIGTVITAAVGLIARYILVYIAQQRATRSVRVALYSQIHRVARLANGQANYVEDEKQPRYIWVPISDINLPSTETAARIEVLTWKEVYEVTAFLSAYHEQIGYILGNARPLEQKEKEEVAPRHLPWGVSPHAQVVGYALSDPDRRKWLVDALVTIRDRAIKARSALGEQLEGSDDLDLRALLRRHRLESMNLRANRGARDCFEGSSSA